MGTMRRLLKLVLGAIVFAGLSSAALAQTNFPTRQVNIVVGFPPGGPTDLYVRTLAKMLTARWNQAVVVENKAGASGSIGGVHVMKSTPDGYTLLFTNNAANGAYEQLNPKAVAYRTMRDFAPVALFGISPSIMVVRATLPVNNATEFVALLKASPGKYTYATSAIGSSPHMASELFQMATGTKMLHVPYSGAAPLITALIGGTVDMYVGGASTVMPHVRSGKLRTIGAVHPTRLASAPDVPTLVEQGIKGVEYASWFGLLAPAATPVPILDKLNADILKVMDSEEMRTQLKGFGIEAQLASRAQFTQTVIEEIERAGRVIKAANMVTE